MAIRRGAVSGEFAVDLGAPRLGMVERFREALVGVSLYWLDSAPMASNSTESVQCSSSPPPARTTSCLPHWISSAPLPMQWALVEQAELME